MKMFNNKMKEFINVYIHVFIKKCFIFPILYFYTLF